MKPVFQFIYDLINSSVMIVALIILSIIFAIIFSYIFPKESDYIYQQLKSEKQFFQNELDELKNEVDSVKSKIEIITAQKEGYIEIPPIELFFSKNSYDIDELNSEKIEYFTEQLRIYHEVLIFGHADELGTKIYNEVLSENRAKEVKKYILAQRPEAKIKEVIGFGEKRQKYRNDNPTAKKMNRRVEIVTIVSKNQILNNKELEKLLQRYEDRLNEYKENEDLLNGKIEKLDEKLEEYKPRETTIGGKIWNFGNWILGFLASLIAIYGFWKMKKENGSEQ